MDKIDFTAPSLLGATLQRNTKQETKKTETEKRIGSRTFFSDILESFTPQIGPLKEFAPSDEALTALLNAVHSTGDELRDRPFQKEILEYKRAVRNFINYVVENAYGINKTQTRQRELRGLKPHIQIQIIDRKLEELAAAILSGQTTQLERVSKLDEIKGLLVDLTITGVIKERNE